MAHHHHHRPRRFDGQFQWAQRSRHSAPWACPSIPPPPSPPSLLPSHPSHPSTHAPHRVPAAPPSLVLRRVVLQQTYSRLSLPFRTHVIRRSVSRTQTPTPSNACVWGSMSHGDRFRKVKRINNFFVPIFKMSVQFQIFQEIVVAIAQEKYRTCPGTAQRRPGMVGVRFLPSPVLPSSLPPPPEVPPDGARAVPRGRRDGGHRVRDPDRRPRPVLVLPIPSSLCGPSALPRGTVGPQ